MEHDHDQQRLTPEQRRGIEEQEERREAGRAAELARQRVLLSATEEDAYVSRRVRREMEAIAEAQRDAMEEEARESDGAPPTNARVLLLFGVLVSALVLWLAFGRG
jgi:hypothetical protein